MKVLLSLNLVYNPIGFIFSFCSFFNPNGAILHNYYTPDFLHIYIKKVLIRSTLEYSYNKNMK